MNATYFTYSSPSSVRRTWCVCVFFTLSRYFHPSSSSTHSARPPCRIFNPREILYTVINIINKITHTRRMIIIGWLSEIIFSRAGKLIYLGNVGLLFWKDLGNFSSSSFHRQTHNHWEYIMCVLSAVETMILENRPTGAWYFGLACSMAHATVKCAPCLYFLKGWSL